jgi:hypothetical protein
MRKANIVSFVLMCCMSCSRNDKNYLFDVSKNKTMRYIIKNEYDNKYQTLEDKEDYWEFEYKNGMFLGTKNEYLPFVSTGIKFKKDADTIQVICSNKFRSKVIPFYSLKLRDTLLVPTLESLNEQEIVFSNNTLYIGETDTVISEYKISCYKFHIYTGMVLNALKKNTSVDNIVYVEKNSFIPVICISNFYLPNGKKRGTITYSLEL